MLYCGYQNNSLVKKALEYVPQEIFEAIEERIAFICLGSDACRVARKLCEDKEIIILSESIFPKSFTDESKPDFRYLIFCILHEVAHAVQKHKSPLFDKLTRQDIDHQESEADKLALDWFNSNISELPHLGLNPITIDEVRAQQDINKRKWDEYCK